MTMTKATAPFRPRAAHLALVAALIFTALGATDASAISVKLRVEGATTTQFNGTVTTGPRSVPGGVDDPTGCRANGTAANFAAANSLTAIADALGTDNIATSGTYFGWGTLACKINGEIPTTPGGGWLVRINQIDATAPNGFVTATDPLTDGDRVVIYLSPAYGYFTNSLELRLPDSAKPGASVTGYVDSYSTADDSKAPGTGVTVSGGGASAASGVDGSIALTFPTAGKFLVTATKNGAIRGSQWVTVAADAVATPVKPSKKSSKKQKIRHGRKINRFVLCRATYKKYSKPYWRCIHIVRAKQRAEARQKD